MLPPEAAAHEGTVDHAGARSVPQDSARWVRRLTLLLLFAAAIVIRFLGLARKPFWFDECFSVELARIDWRNFLHLLWWREANMSLYYVLLRLWLHFGQSEFFIRSLSAVIAAATLLAVYWLANELYGRRVALIAAALITFNAYHVRYAQEARAYALFVLLATLASGALVVFLRRPSRWHRYGYVLASILAVYTHLYALLLVLAHALALRWLGYPTLPSDKPGTDLSGQMRRAWITIGVAVLPLLIFVAKTGAGPIRWIARPGFHDLLAFCAHLAGGVTWPLPTLYALACMAAVAPVRRRLWAHGQVWEIWRCQFLLIWLFFPVALTLLLSVARPVFLARYLIFCLPPLLVLGAAGLARLRPSWLLAMALCVLLMFSLQGVFFIRDHDFDNERDGSGAATYLILEHSQPGDGVIFHIADTRVSYEFFRSVQAGQNTASSHFTAHLGPEILFPRHSTGLDYRDFTGKPTADLVRSLAPNHARLWVMLMNNGPATSPDPSTVMLRQILTESFPEQQQWQFPKVEVRLYSKP